MLAGGQSLVPLLNLGFAEPEVVVSLDRCADLSQLTFGESAAYLGASVTTRRIELDANLAARCPLMVAAAGKVGSPHVRNFGTLVGNLCHADPGSDLIPAALCLGVEVEVRSTLRTRLLGVDKLVVGPFVTSLAPDELAVAVHLPLHHHSWRHSYRKLALRAGDLAIATAAALLSLENNTVTEARVVVGGALRRAGRIRRIESTLVGTDTAEVANAALATNWIEDLSDDLLVDPAIPADYLNSMLPRFVAATLHDAVTGPL